MAANFPGGRRAALSSVCLHELVWLLLCSSFLFVDTTLNDKDDVVPVCMLS